jgi:hypothetical protein
VVGGGLCGGFSAGGLGGVWGLLLGGEKVTPLHQGTDGRAPSRAFIEGMPKFSDPEVTSQTKTARLKAD